MAKKSTTLPNGSPKKQQTKPSNNETILHKTEAKISHALSTLTYHEIQTWQQDNHYILSGYRPASNSYLISFSSIITHLHNETLNIWTHLLGSLAALLIGLLLLTSVYILAPSERFSLATSQDILVFGCFFIGAFACLGMSAIFHTLSNHSAAVQKAGNRLDYIGIILLIWGSFVPSIFYGFQGEPRLVKLYWSMITTIGAGTFVVVMHPKFRSPAWRPFRATMFIMMGLSAVVPVLHGIKLYGLERMERQIGLSWVVSMGVLYITGAVIYAARVPERWNPGKFDIFGSSHQIFHVLVLMAAAAHLIGLLKAFDYEHQSRLEALLVQTGVKS